MAKPNDVRTSRPELFSLTEKVLSDCEIMIRYASDEGKEIPVNALNIIEKARADLSRYRERFMAVAPGIVDSSD